MVSKRVIRAWVCWRISTNDFIEEKELLYESQKLINRTHL